MRRRGRACRRYAGRDRVGPVRLAGGTAVRPGERTSRALSAVASQEKRRACSTARSPTPAPGPGRRRIGQAGGQLAGVGGVEQQARVADDLDLRRVVAGDHRRPAVHRLEDGEPEALIQRGEHERRAPLIQDPQRLVREPVGQDQLIGDAAVAGELAQPALGAPLAGRRSRPTGGPASARAAASRRPRSGPTCSCGSPWPPRRRRTAA